MAIAVSVILPTFNRADQLVAAARSVLQQSFGDLELIIVDDGSTDDIAAVAAGLADGRVVYVRREENGGASAARNVGLAEAKGRFIAFQDSDDLWLPEKLGRQVALLNSLPPEYGAVLGSKIVYGRDEKHRYGEGKVAISPAPSERLMPGDDQVMRFMLSNRISLQNALFRRDAMAEPLWFDPCAKANADWEFSARLAQQCKIYEDPAPVVMAFIGSDSISTNPRKRALGLLRILRKNRAVLERYPNALASNYVRLSNYLVRTGKPRRALAFLIAALRIKPSLAWPARAEAKRIALTMAAPLLGRRTVRRVTASNRPAFVADAGVRRAA